jgi:Tfp pilus assembly protein PilO
MTINLRIWGAACGAAAIAVLAGGWFLGVQPAFAAAADATQNANGIDAQNQATRVKLATLSKAAAKLDALEADNGVLLKSVPSVLKPNTFIRRIGEVAALDGVSVVSITPGDAVAYSPPASASGAAAAATAGGAPAPALAKTDPLITAANFTAVPVNVSISGSPTAVLQFTHDIQNDERVFSIDGIQSTKNDDSADVTTSLSGYIYVLKR